MTPSVAAFGGNESCPNCGARMAADQRYCLNCGARRGEPRLPFMDAVVFMESMSAPAGTPPPPPAGENRSSSRMNANAALIAGVATLVLAIGVGFLIGRAGHDEAASGGGAVKIVQLGSTGGGEEGAATTPAEEPGGGSEGKGKGSGKSAIKAQDKGTTKTQKNLSEGAHGQTEAVEKVLHTENGVELETEVEVGGACKKGTAGCGKSGKFEGNFFGE